MAEDWLAVSPGFVLTVFILTYVGMAVGRVPGFRVDRTGIALVAAIVMFVAGASSGDRIVEAVDFPTLVILFGLMILSAQFAASGFYDWVSLRVSTARGSPAVLLASTVAVAGGLSAMLANDVVVFAMTPLLCIGLRSRGLDPRPYLIAVAGAANAGSAATIIGNPQNIVIGQVGQLDFWAFLGVCGVPALAGLGCVFLVVWVVWRKRLHVPGAPSEPLPSETFDRFQLGKALIATAVLLFLFASPVADENGVLLVAGALLISRKLRSRDMIGMVDWHLLVLIVSLFIVTDALAQTGLIALGVEQITAAGLLPDRLVTMAPLALIASNTIGNVPAVIMILSIWPEMPAGTLYALAVLTTLAGNFILIGSLANLIVAERAASVGVRLTFLEHARCGVPMTLLSFAFAMLWLWGLGVLPLS